MLWWLRLGATWIGCRPAIGCGVHPRRAQVLEGRTAKAKGQRPKAKGCIGALVHWAAVDGAWPAGLGARTRPRYPGRCRLRAGLLAIGRGERSLVSLLGP